MAGKISCALLVLALVAAVNADITLHNMRGSSNRLNENNQNRNNANRLFDSQNNNQGGYNVGDMNNAADGLGVMNYYATSQLTIEWNAQHGATNPNAFGNFVLTYMCDDKGTGIYDNTGLRDGTDTNTVDNNNDNVNSGRHEATAFYNDCAARNRNANLFLADQSGNLNGNSAIYTRQNTNGARYGTECPEEREYYPYWHPSPWKDIAVLTPQPQLCSYYQKNSPNVASYNYCSVPTENNADSCASQGGQWLSQPAWGLSTVDCQQVGFSRDNHQGNTIGGQMLSYNWTIPGDMVGKTCVFRIRYNVSTGDFNGWAINASSNDDNSPVHNNPTVDFGSSKQSVSLKLEINTDQFFRTFEERSHTFNVKARPGSLPSSALLYNLNVRGRRGNIVQTYPAVEYDFTPNTLVIGKNDYVHIQWTGSLNTPDGAGTGAASTDRSNIVQIQSMNHNYPFTFAQTTMFSQTDAMNLATVGKGAGLTSGVLDDCPAYYDAGVLQPGQGKPGAYFFMSTRNNNFSNRSQKGRIIVTN